MFRPQVRVPELLHQHLPATTTTTTHTHAHAHTHARTHARTHTHTHTQLIAMNDNVQRAGGDQPESTPPTTTQTDNSFIENSMEAGILLGGTPHPHHTHTPPHTHAVATHTQLPTTGILRTV